MRIKRLLVLAALASCAACSIGSTEVQAASCTYADLDVLQLSVGFDGWIMVSRRSLAARDIALAKACAAAPARWAWTNRDFNRSTRLIDRLYPGAWHGAWARRCAGSEGGHGAWVPNRHGSGAGGWLQFMSGTFYGVIDSALVRARWHGVRVPSFARSWYSPLGQALAGSEMLFRGRRSEWTGATC